LHHTTFINHKDTKALSCATGLWSVSPQVFNRNGMSPRNLFNCNAHGSGQPLPLERTRRVIAADDGLDQLGFQTCRSNQLIDSYTGLFHVTRERFHGRNLITAF
jgi:hypothetical protein